VPKPLHKWRNPDGGYLQYLRNVHLRRTEADYFPALTAAATTDWLKENARDGDFFLHVEFFDPHEPFDPPKGYAERYGLDKKHPLIIYPRYGLSDVFTTGEMQNIRALYAGEVTLVDKYVGRILAAVKRLGLARKTAVIFTSDHGYFLGDHGLQGKALVDQAKTAKESMPFYQELAHVPLLIRLPGVKAGRRGAIVQPVDLMPTLLELFGLVKSPPGREAGALAPPRPVLTPRGEKAAAATGFDPQKLHGRSIVPVIKGKAKRHREIAVTSYSHKFHDPLLVRTAINDGEFTLHYSGGDGTQQTRWTAATKRKSGFRGGTEPFLVHRESDPTEDRNLLAPGAETPPGLEGLDAGAKGKELHAKYVRLLEEIETPEENLAGRRWWPED